MIPVDRLDRFAKLPMVVGEGRRSVMRRNFSRCWRANPISRPASPPRSASATGAGTCASTMRSTCCFPPMTPAAAWAQLARLERSSALLKREVQTVDMRLPDRLVLRVSPEPPKEAPDPRKGAPRRRTHEHNGRSAGTRSGIRPVARDPGESKPKRRPAIRPRGSLIAAVDIGTTKICCFIARGRGDEPRVLGIGHQISRGVRNGTIIDLEAAGTSICQRGARRRGDGRRDDRAGRRRICRAVLRLAHRQGRDQRCRARDHRRRYAAGAGAAAI